MNSHGHFIRIAYYLAEIDKNLDFLGLIGTYNMKLLKIFDLATNELIGMVDHFVYFFIRKGAIQ